jgi:PhnB protein
MQPSLKGFSLSLGKTFWSPDFGTLEDQFGVDWMVIVPP